MATAIGIVSTFGLTAPSGAVVQKSSRKRRGTLAKVTDSVSTRHGVTVMAEMEKGVEVDVTLSGKGAVAFAAVTAGEITVGTVKQVGAKQMQSNTDFPDFEVTGKTYANRA